MLTYSGRVWPHGKPMRLTSVQENLAQPFRVRASLRLIPPWYKAIKGAMFMDITKPNHDTLLARVNRLEIQTRIWQIAALVLLAIVGFSRTANVKAQQRSQSEPARGTTVEAQNFLLKDATGAVRGQLTVRDSKAQLELYDSTGKVTWSTNTRPQF
jgi:hypothetical protein